MATWASVRDRMPDSETECLVTQKIGALEKTYPKYAEWDGASWIDVDGCEVEHVEWWMKAPIFEKGQRIVEKLIQCVENDHCENKDCCYFARLDELEALLEYMKN